MKLARLDSDIGRAQNAYDVFVALDDAGRRVGKCSIVPYKADDLLPDCPFNIFIDLDGELRSMDMLLGAALAVADEVWMLENSIYSVISPEGAASIIWKDAKRVKEASEVLKLTADDLSALGVVERVISEKDGFAAVNTEMKSALEETIARLQACDTDELLQNRYEKFRRIGRPEV